MVAGKFKPAYFRRYEKLWRRVDRIVSVNILDIVKENKYTKYTNPIRCCRPVQSDSDPGSGITAV